MQKTLFFIICIVTLAVIEAVPWYNKSPTRRRGETAIESDATDFGVEEFAVNGGDVKTERETGFKSLNRGDHNPNENEENYGADVEQDNEQNAGEERRGFQDTPGHQGGRGYQASRGNQGNRGSQGGFRNTGGFGDLDGRRNPPSRANGGRRRNQKDNRRHEDSESEEDSHEYTKKSKHSCRRCVLNSIGNGSSNRNSVYLHED